MNKKKPILTFIFKSLQKLLSKNKFLKNSKTKITQI